MNKPEDVTIIIPVYCSHAQSMEWLDECLASATTQGCSVALYDDGSPLSPRKVVSKYNLDGSIIYGNHVGVASARNRAISVAKTSLVLPLDCDDRLKPEAISTLLTYWTGVPVYPDVAKFGAEVTEHYHLLDFDCSLVYKHVGFSSVNVLYSKTQFNAVGGYREDLDFYEDGEYNARLFLRYCAVRCPHPLVEYRMHEHQRTKSYKQRSAQYARRVLQLIGDIDMACPSCSGKRRAAAALVAANQPIPTTVDVNSMALTMPDGKVLVQYVGGKGRGRHYYNGITTGMAHKVTYGDYLYVDPSDARQINEPKPTYFVRVVRSASAPTPEPIVVVEPPPQVVEEAVTRTAVVREVVRKPVEDDVPDIATMSVDQIMMLDNLTPDIARLLLRNELRGRNRAKVVNWLKGKTR
jgi:hypothetical protein